MLSSTTSSKSSRIARLAGSIFVLAALSATASAAEISGTWINHTGEGAIEIAPCGESLCGRIVWLKSPVNKAGKPLVDALNPRPSRRKRPICGLPVIGGVTPQSDGTWDYGWIYDPKQGKAFDVALTLQAPDQLEVLGYQGLKFLSKRFIWRRAPDDLPRCDAP